MRGWKVAAALCAVLSLCTAASLASPAFANAEEKPEEATVDGLADRPVPGTIVGGRPAPAGAWPWQIALLRNGSFICGGSIVHRQWIATAAHCVEGQEPSAFQVLVGTNNLNSGGRRIAVTGVIVHPNYDSDTEDSDIALLNLAQTVSQRAVVPITPRQERNFAAPGTNATITGWGRTTEGGQISQRLMQARVPIRTPAYCRNRYGSSSITQRMLCAGLNRGGVDSCQGDSGGPLVVQNNRGRWMLAGITSWGIGCARPGQPGVYTRVSQFSKWIKDRINQVANCYARNLRPAIRKPRDFQCLQLAANDDFSAESVPIGFPVRFGGQRYSTVYVNNNGNLTFGSPLRTYTPVALSRITPPIIAPFFADVDTRGARSDLVYYGTATVGGRRAFVALYQNVGYYNQKTNKLNSFQVVLIEQGRRGSGNFDIEFNYSRIQWETGDASGGNNGLGGNAARVGWSTGNRAAEWRGSGVAGRYLDTNRRTRLIAASNVGTPGRLVYQVRNGTVRRAAAGS